MIFVKDEDGYNEIADACAECEHSYVDDLFYEWNCKLNQCKYNRAEIARIIKQERMKGADDDQSIL